MARPRKQPEISEEWKNFIMEWKGYVNRALEEFEANNAKINKQFESLDQKLQEFEARIENLNNKLTVLQIKAGFWGAFFGFIAAATSFLINWIRR